MCVLIPLIDNFVAESRWASDVPGLERLIVQDHGRELGLELGPGAHRSHWSSVLRKMASRIGDIRAAVKSLSSRTFMFNVYVASLFMYKPSSQRFRDMPYLPTKPRRSA